MIDFEVQRCTRRCAATDQPLAPGEEYFSLLRSNEGVVERLDYRRDAWPGPPDDAVGWWKATMPAAGPAGAKLAPNDVLLRLFDEWADDPDRADARYVLALLLVRRKVFRLAEPSSDDAEPTDALRVDCPRRDESYELAAIAPGADRAAAIQAELHELLYAEPQ